MRYDLQIDAATSSDPLFVAECELSLANGEVEVAVLAYTAYTDEGSYETLDFDEDEIGDLVRAELDAGDMTRLQVEAEAAACEAWAVSQAF